MTAKSWTTLIDENGEVQDLFAGLVLIAQEEDQNFDPLSFRETFLSLKEKLHINQDEDIYTQIARFNYHFFEELQFHGEEEDYYHPHNSLIHKVIQKRSGLPILLASVYIELAKLFQLDVNPIAFPGHFLIGVQEPEFFIDVFHKGKILRKEQLEKRFALFSFAQDLSLEETLKPASTTHILIRINNNLIHAYQKGSSPQGILRAIDRNLLLMPQNTQVYRAKAYLLRSMGKYKEAAQNLEIFLAYHPNHPKALELLQELSLLKGIG